MILDNFHPLHGGMTRRSCLSLLAGTAAAMIAPGICAGPSDGNPLCVAVSTDTLAGANVNDARAAYNIWIREITRNLGVTRAVPVPEIFLPSDQLLHSIREGTVQCYGVTALEYTKVSEVTDPDCFLLPDYLADGMEYVLLVHNESRFTKISDLRGGQVLTHRHRDMLLLPEWLGTLLAAHSLPPADRFFGSVAARDSVNEVALPVFFRRVDAACLARRNWEVAVELNPQLGKDVRVLALSPKIVPIAVCFRRGCSPVGKQEFIQAVLHVTAMPAGQQIVALYQSRGFVLRTDKAMKSSVEMIHEYERVLTQKAGPRRG